MKKLFLIVPLSVIALILIVILYVKFVLPNVGPAPKIKIEATPERLARGEYLATRAMGCVVCHSQRDLTLYSAPVIGTHFGGGGEEFTVELGAPGNFYAPNLTPFHLKDWTDGEIYRAITSGVSKDGRALFPGMPYDLYGQASKEDIYSVIAYLRTLPTYEYTVPEPEPASLFSIILNTIPKKIENKNIPDRKNMLEYGEYVITQAACIHCHTPFVKGKYVMEEAYSGNREFIMPNGIVRSSNITPDKNTGIGNWTEEFFVNRFKMYNDSNYTAVKVGDGFNTIMPWTTYAGLDEYDLKSIYAYLQSLKPIEKQAVKYTPK